MLRKHLAVALALGCTLTGAAWAQEEEEGAVGGEAPVAEPAPAPAPTPTPAAVAETTDDGEEIDRPPMAKGIGIGAGYTISSSTDITKPTTGSVLFWLSPNLGFETEIDLHFTGSSTNPAGDDNTTTASAFQITLGGLAHYVMASHRKVDFKLLGGLSFGFGSETENPPGDDNTNVDSTMGVSIVWGLGLEYFFWKHVGLGFDAYNPLLSFASSSNNPAGDDNTTVETSYLFGAIWDPTLRLVFRVYY